jgi:hypothetical protein
VTCSGGSGRGGWRAAGGSEQGHPFVLAVPGFGQVQGDVAATVPGAAGGDLDEVAADGGAAGLAVGEAGQGSGGAQQIAGDGGAGQPGGIGREEPRWQVGQRAVVPVGEDLLYDPWSRCCSSAWTSSNGESVNTAW